MSWCRIPNRPHWPRGNARCGQGSLQLSGERGSKVSGTLSGSIIYNARLVVDAEKIADKRIDPSAKDKDPLALEMEQHFKKDSKVIAAKLNDVGIETASALYHRIRNDRSEVGVFSRYLKVPEQSIKEFLSALASKPENASLVRASPRLPVRRGVNLSGLAKVRGVPVKTKAPTTPPKFPAAARTPNLPSKVDLTPYVTPVKNQGLRGTCVAHGGSVPGSGLLPQGRWQAEPRPLRALQCTGPASRSTVP